MIVGAVGRIGQRTLEGVTFVGEATKLWCRATSLVLRGAIDWRNTLQQMELIGVNAAALVFLTVTFGGMVMAVYSVSEFQRFGATEYLGGLIGLSIVRELGPVLTAIVVAARSGSAIAAEIGTMKVTEQLDALRALATDPIEYLVVPRYLASLITLPLLTIMADVCGTMGGFVVAVGAGVSREIYLKSVLRLVKADHLLTGLVKAVVFGTLISIVGCQQGFRTGQGAAAVGRATTNSVVLCVVLVHIADYFLALIFG